MIHIAPSLEGVEAAVEGGLRFYRTLCGSTAHLENLVVDGEDGADCGTCLSMWKRRGAVSGAGAVQDPVRDLSPSSDSGSRLPAGAGGREAWDLRDYDELEEGEEESEGSEEVVKYPEPMEGISIEELGGRLGKDPKTDPKGKLGNLEVDVRSVLSEQERMEADQILALVGSMPPAQPLLRTIYRLCHRLAWLESQQT